MRRALWACVCVLAACRGEAPNAWPGWIEADERWLASELGGKVVAVEVEEGAHVAKGAELVRLDAALLAAEQRAVAARIEAAKAQIRALKAQKALADAELARAERLARAEASSKEAWDRARAQAKVLAAQIAAARHELRALEARRAELAARMDKLVVRAPRSGIVEEVLKRPGEVARPGEALVRFWPDDAIKIIAFVPVAALDGIHRGAVLSVRSEGKAFRARVVRVEDAPVYAPPVLYTGKHAETLRYRVELVPVEGIALHPGAPAEVVAP